MLATLIQRHIKNIVSFYDYIYTIYHLLNLSWIIKCLVLRNIESLKSDSESYFTHTGVASTFKKIIVFNICFCVIICTNKYFQATEKCHSPNEVISVRLTCT